MSVSQKKTELKLKHQRPDISNKGGKEVIEKSIKCKLAPTFNIVSLLEMFKPTISESDPFSDNMLKLNWTQKVLYIKWGEERWVGVPQKQNTVMSQPHWLVWLGFWQTSWLVRTDANYISDGFEAATEEDDPHAKSFLLLLSHETIRSTNRDELNMMRLWAHSIGAFRDPIPSYPFTYIAFKH